MKRFKDWENRIITSLLSLTVMFSLVQLPVHADSNKVWVNGVNIVADADNTVECGNGIASYDVDTNTLTLNNAQITHSNVAGYGIHNELDADFNIILQGSNRIDIKETTGIFAFSESNMTFSGGGSLDISAKQNISNHKNITFDNVTITATGSEDGSIVSDGDVIIKNGSDITCGGTYFGFNVLGDVTISESDVTATASLDKMNAFFITGKIEILNNSTVNTTSSYPPLFSKSDIIIKDSTVVAKATADWAIYAQGNLAISGDSEITAKGSKGSLGASQTATITPKQGESIEIISGSDENSAVVIQGSPFSKETDLKGLNVGNKQYFHSKKHTHIASTTWSKDTTNHWHECTSNDGEKMEIAAHTFGEWIIDTAATETTKGSKHRECVCGQIETIEIPATGENTTKPDITAGAGSIHQISNGKDMTLTCSGKLEDLTGIYVDGQLLSPDNYTLKSGSTILTLKASFLDTLSIGKHTLKFQYKNNISAETDFTITRKIGETTGPKTSDTSNTMQYIILIALSGCVMGLGLKKKKSLNK